MRDRMPDKLDWRLAAPVAAVVVLIVGIAALVLGVGRDEQGPTSGPTAGSNPRHEPPASFLARMIPPPAVRQPTARRAASGVTAVAARLPIERKVAQLFLLGFEGQDLTAPIFERLRSVDLGGIVIDGVNYSSSDQLAALAGEAGVIAKQADHVEPWVMAPQEGGELNAFPDLPPASAAADLPSDAAAFDEAKQAADALGGLGIDGVLAPVADVAPPDGPALGRRAYSDDPHEVATYVTAVVDAYREASVLTAAGHFPGLGGGSQDTRQGVSQIASGLATLSRRDLVPFRAAIRAGVPAILMSNGLYVTDDFVTPASLSHRLTTDLLRDKLGFAGIAITDDLADPSVTALTTIPEAAVRAVKAGADLLYVSGPPEEQQAAYAAVLRAARSGKISRARLDEAVRRDLEVKHDYGLLP